MSCERRQRYRADRTAGQRERERRLQSAPPPHLVRGRRLGGPRPQRPGRRLLVPGLRRNRLRPARHLRRPMGTPGAPRNQ
nr:MAG TPA: hypothetical protein [Caudoviricetes sp.]